MVQQKRVILETNFVWSAGMSVLQVERYEALDGILIFTQVCNLIENLTTFLSYLSDLLEGGRQVSGQANNSVTF